LQATYFGDRSARLFGVYHPPCAQVARDAAVLLCQPGAQEYNAAHWAFRKLAALLSREGFHVLRFDWRGTGDSAGESDEGCPELWLADVRTAARELLDLSGVPALSLVGMRLGAALALQACAAGLPVRDLVLWEPVVTGAAYLTELASLETRRSLQLLHPLPSGERDELLGFRFPQPLRRAIEAIDLRAAGRLPARRALLFAPAPRPDFEELRRSLAAAGNSVELHVVEDGAAAGHQREAALLQGRILSAMAAALAGRAP
jgi:pimeloyl-ACP methyl ester carboxylesterase